MKSKKYQVEDLISLIEGYKSTDEIGLLYGVSGRSVRNWFKNEGLGSKVKYIGHRNITSGINQKKANENSRITLAAKDKKLVTCKCEVCNDDYVVKESVYVKYGTRFCSNKCKYKFLFKTNPENHPRWKGGLTSINQIGRANLEYCEWRLNVYKRDFYTCRKCGGVGKNLNAHHIESWAENPDMKYDVDNGITLCQHCHISLHKEYGQKTTICDLTIFINSKNK